METDTKEAETKPKKSAKKASPTVKRSTVLILIGGFILGLLVGLVVTSAGVTGAAVSEGAVESKLTTLFPTVEITSVESAGAFYIVEFISNGLSTSVLVTNDGRYLVTGGEIVEDVVIMEGAAVIDLDALAIQIAEAEAEQEESVSVDATEKPTVELFVMSYCPYGLQMEKAFLPVKGLLGDYADFSVKFVHYLMHGEKEAVENARQYCIQKDTPDKFDAYLTCFIKDGEGKEQACMDAAGIASAQVDSCIADTYTEFGVDEDLASGDQFPRFGIDKVASEGYGVQGSPTLVINGAIVNAGRTPEAVKQAVCNAFVDAPEACNTALSSDGFTAGFGLDAGAGGAAGGCEV